MCPIQLEVPILLERRSDRKIKYLTIVGVLYYSCIWSTVCFIVTTLALKVKGQFGEFPTELSCIWTQ